MKLIRGFHAIESAQRGCVITLGNFDGMHLGHQALLQQLKSLSKQTQSPSLVLLFEPHPQEYFLKKQAPARLLRVSDKLKLLRALQIDYVVCLRFNETIARITAEEFITHYLVQRLAIRGCVVGIDVRFGYQGKGNFALLKQLGREYSFITLGLPPIFYEGVRISSSHIRRDLSEQKFTQASYLLTRPFTINGRVIHGQARGRQLGFPTANIALHRLVSPVHGVFIVRVYGLEEQPLLGIANIGRRPSFQGTQELLEVHLLNFSQSIYGKFLEVEFLKKIREEKKFMNPEQLRMQIAHDKLVAEYYFKH